MNEILVKDGVKYTEWTPKKEEELERMAVNHSKDIFGENSIYFDIKKKIHTNIGEGTIPDGYLIDFDANEFYIIEVELSTHHEYKHINEQIGKFISALKKPKTRQKLARIFKEHILSDFDITLEKFVKNKTGNKEIYEFFLDILENVKEKQEYSVIVLIDKNTDKISDACDILNPKPNIIEFKTFAREDVNPKKVHIHLFEPLHPFEIKKDKDAVRKGKKVEKIPTGPRKEGWKNKDYVRAGYIKLFEEILRGENIKNKMDRVQKIIKEKWGEDVEPGTISGYSGYSSVYKDLEGNANDWVKKGLDELLEKKEEWKRKGWTEHPK